MEQTQISFFRTSNRLDSVHIFVIKFEHPIFGFERMDIVEYQTKFDSSLTVGNTGRMAQF